MGTVSAEDPRDRRTPYLQKRPIAAESLFARYRDTEIMEEPLDYDKMLVQVWNRREDPRTFQGSGSVVTLRVQSENGPIQMSGLATDGSLTGMGLVIVAGAPLYEGDACTVSLGREEPINAKIIWIEELERNVLRLGLEYLS